MTGFDTFAMVDWSGGNQRPVKPSADAIWACVVRHGQAEEPVYLRHRGLAECWLEGLIEVELTAGRRLCLGFDFPFGYPVGFAQALTGSDDPLMLWDWFEARIEDAPGHNNRFDLAGKINRKFGGTGPFWANGLKRDIDGLGRTKAGYTNPFPERRVVEGLARGSFTCWQMAGAGAVGSQVMMGLPVLARLRRRFAGQVAVWPFEVLDTPVALVEIWPSLINRAVMEEMQRLVTPIKDAVQVRLVALAMAGIDPDRIQRMLDVDAPEEGWILGQSYEDELNAAARASVADGPVPPPLRNDCFALPTGVEWTPVDQALRLLRDRLKVVVGSKAMGLTQALGHVLSADVVAQRSNPPVANSAVDGYGFAGAIPPGAHVMPLQAGRAAAGVPFEGVVAPGKALRVLTGAAIPPGMETVILEEDVNLKGDKIAFNGPLKQGANARRAGEDVMASKVVLEAGRRLTPADMALLSAVGVGRVETYAPLRVAVLSTGDELVEAGQVAGPGKIYDANRPMLLAMLEKFGFQGVDLGRVPDDRATLRAALDTAAEQADVILTSGGASAGDEDHVSALLSEAGALQAWRIAIKPGRPLALAMWQGTPVFGLPGNPVAAMICTLVFARPAMGLLAGEGWREPVGFEVSADFDKRKKAGRREYLRARVRGGVVEVFGSEGSGRISGLSWAEGLVELPDGALDIRRGDLVRYIPYGSFGL
ncbi:MAG: molybdopterin-binding protein [Rhodobacteraceae bacterium]|nr:molybdopterin-binding protein [Paracoccaceae bacterium]